MIFIKAVSCVRIYRNTYGLPTKTWVYFFDVSANLLLPTAEFCFMVDALRRFYRFEVDNKTISKKMVWALCSVVILLMVNIALS